MKSNISIVLMVLFAFFGNNLNAQSSTNQPTLSNGSVVETTSTKSTVNNNKENLPVIGSEGTVQEKSKTESNNSGNSTPQLGNTGKKD